MKSFIYALLCPDTKRIMYVGMTKNPKRRYNQFIYFKGKGLVYKWIATLKERPIMKILEIVKKGDIPAHREMFWITKYMKSGHGLNIDSSGVKDHVMHMRVTKEEDDHLILMADKYTNGNKSLFVHIAIQEVSKLIINGTIPPVKLKKKALNKEGPKKE